MDPRLLDTSRTFAPAGHPSFLIRKGSISAEVASGLPTSYPRPCALWPHVADTKPRVLRTGLLDLWPKPSRALLVGFGLLGHGANTVLAILRAPGHPG